MPQSVWANVGKTGCGEECPPVATDGGAVVQRRPVPRGKYEVQVLPSYTRRFAHGHLRLTVLRQFPYYLGGNRNSTTTLPGFRGGEFPRMVGEPDEGMPD